MASSYEDHEIMVVAPPTPQSAHPDSLNSVTALARFEFEPGRGNAGTKIMMVEWEDEDKSRDSTGTWQVSWPGKSTVFTAEKSSEDAQRLYFLLPPGANVPPHITIAYQPPSTPETADAGEPEAPLRMSVNPLPAIFTPELGATAKASGKKGVLHTIWAKKRLQSLEKEIKREQEANFEGIALEMALAEKEWIESNFGIGVQRPPALDMSALAAGATSPPLSPSIQSPKSPGGRRLVEKLKGLSISTSEKDLLGSRGVNTPTRESHPLSPETGDMAYSSFSAFRDQPLSQQHSSKSQTKKIVAQSPPGFIKQQQAQSKGSSLDFIATSTSGIEKTNETESKPITQGVNNNNNNTADVDEDNDDDNDAGKDDLFAVALSPRSPDDPKSPFSIPSSEVSAFARIKGTQP